MLAIHFFGSAQVWNMSRVPLYRQEEARVILQARYEARMKQRNKDLKAGASAAEIVLPDF
jgi:hypothetical protein